MQAAISQLSDQARQRILSLPGEPLFQGDWLRVLFIHFAMEPAGLQPRIPYELDLHDGRAWVSLVAFRMENLRPRIGGRLLAPLFRPWTTHEFLNLRTYVRHGSESGIFFISELVSNRLAVPLGPLFFGLPYRHGRLHYEHDAAAGRFRVRAAAGSPDAQFHCDAFLPPGTVAARGAENARDAFLLERYTAFTCWRGLRRFFRIWHEPWPQTPVQVEITDDTLPRSCWPWLADARFISANYSPGLRDIWMGRPHRVDFTGSDYRNERVSSRMSQKTHR